MLKVPQFCNQIDVKNTEVQQFADSMNATQQDVQFNFGHKTLKITRFHVI